MWNRCRQANVLWKSAFQAKTTQSKENENKKKLKQHTITRGERLLRKTQISKNLISHQLHENALRRLRTDQKGIYDDIQLNHMIVARFIPLNYSIKPQIKWKWRVFPPNNRGLKTLKSAKSNRNKNSLLLTYFPFWFAIRMRNIARALQKHDLSPATHHYDCGSFQSVRKLHIAPDINYYWFWDSIISAHGWTHNLTIDLPLIAYNLLIQIVSLFRFLVVPGKTGCGAINLIAFNSNLIRYLDAFDVISVSNDANYITMRNFELLAFFEWYALQSHRISLHSSCYTKNKKQNVKYFFSVVFFVI